MGCCESRNHDFDYIPSKQSEGSNLEPISDKQLLLYQRALLMEDNLLFLSNDAAEPSLASPFYLSDHIHFQDIENISDSDVKSRFDYALELLSENSVWESELQDNAIRIFSQESSRFGPKSSVIKEEIIFEDYYPTAKILDALYDPAKRMAWDKNVTYMLNEGEDKNDVICYNRIEYFIIKKYLAERRVILRYKDDVVVIYYSVDKEVPQELAKGASLRKILMGVHIIHQESDNTKLTVLTQLEAVPNLGKKLVIRGIVSWIKSFKKYLRKTNNK